MLFSRLRSVQAVGAILRRCSHVASEQATMRAAVFDSDSGSTFMTRVAVPDIGGGDLRIQVHAASINPIDVAMRGGYGRALFGQIHNEPPIYTGCDASGTVIEVGGGASWSFKVCS